MNTLKSVAGRTAIVTGTSRGIGPHIARALADEGMRVVLAARSRQELEDVASALSADGAEVRQEAPPEGEEGRRCPGNWVARGIKQAESDKSLSEALLSPHHDESCVRNPTHGRCRCRQWLTCRAMLISAGAP